MTNLLERFEAFIKTVRGFESIDELLKDVHLEGKKRADYLLWDRQIIVEQKVLLDDPADKRTCDSPTALVFSLASLAVRCYTLSTVRCAPVDSTVGAKKNRTAHDKIRQIFDTEVKRSSWGQASSS
jgi:hypothetical protein